MNQYTVGTAIELLVNFTNEDGDPVDPTEVTGTIRQPDETEAALTVLRDDLGSYSAKYTPTMNGLHEYQFVGAGASPSVVEDRFTAQTVFPGA